MAFMVPRRSALWPNEPLLFEVYGQAVQGRPGTEQLLDLLATQDRAGVDAAMKAWIDLDLRR
jgi:hypothetical protein